MVHDLELGPHNSYGTNLLKSAETRILGAFDHIKNNIIEESAMPRREENGGPGRTRTFDLPIMRPG
jgi:hypothetical protein